MPSYNVTAPDGTTYTVNAPDGATEQDAIAYVQKNLYKPLQERNRLGETALGVARGVADIGNTLLKLPGLKQLGQLGYEALGGTGQREDSLNALDQSNKDSNYYSGGRLAGNILATAPVGGILGAGAARVGLPALGQALTTGGFRAGGAGLGTRMAGGAITGAASAGLVSPDDALAGGAIGAALPAGVMGAGKLGGAIRKSFAPAIQKKAIEIAKLMGVNLDDVLVALQQQGPSMIGQGYQRTVPQILQSPVTSQLQRTLKTAGDDALGSAERLQQQQFMDALERVAPIQATPIDAAQRAGGAIQSYALPARENASQAVRNAFDEVDIEDASRLFLPIEEMQKAQAKHLGAGTFGTGSKAAQAVKTAQDVGTEFIPGIKPMSQPKGTQSLEQAVRAAGGIKGGSTGLGGELRALGNKQSGTSGLMNNKSGKSADLLAQDMHARGFIPDDDPATLMEYLRNGRGRDVYANDATDDGFRAAFERSMGDAPGDMVIPKAVPFQTIQNLRSSIGEAAESASAKGANKEAAALRSMVADIDSRVNRAAGSSIAPGEYFPKEMADRYRAALKMHQNKIAQFDTGPQASMFRKGGDGQASIQGAEIPSKFYNSALSQIDDVKAFKRLIGDNEALANELKSFAMTQGANSADAMGNLGDKFVKFVRARSGANRELFTPNELATVNRVAKEVQNQLRSERLGQVSNSDTAQKLKSLQSLGLLDSGALNSFANQIPLIGRFTGPMLQGLRNTAQSTQQATIAKLLADPQLMADSIMRYTAPRPGLLSGIGDDYLRIAPQSLGLLGAPMLSQGSLAGQQ